MTKKLIEIAAGLVQTQAVSASMTTMEIASSLREVFSTLQSLEKAETAGINIEFTQPGHRGSSRNEAHTTGFDPER